MLLACEGALSPETTVTFTTPVNVTDLMPDAPASYFDGDIKVNPMPVITGVNTTITAKLTNPLATPVTVDVSFNYAQAGIGLVFGPIKDIVGQVIPGNSSVFVSASFLPAVSGHYCVQVTYNITAIGLAPVAPANAGWRQRKPAVELVCVYRDHWVRRRRKRPWLEPIQPSKWSVKSRLVQPRFKRRLWGGGGVGRKGRLSDATAAMGLDPPRQDYNQVTMPVRHPIPPVQPDANISVARAAALNAVNDALTDVEAFGSAATTAMDRYGGASEANNLQWASEQANELLFYQEQFGTALLSYADRLDAFVLVLQTEGETQITVSVSDITSYQQRLTTQGFSAQEIADAKLIGWTDAQIEAYRQAIIAANPNDVAGNLLEKYTNEASVSRDLGNALLHPPIFNPSYSVSGSAGNLAGGAAGNTMAQVYNSVTTIQLANPLAQTALINVNAGGSICLPIGRSMSRRCRSPLPQGSRRRSR